MDVHEGDDLYLLNIYIVLTSVDDYSARDANLYMSLEQHSVGCNYMRDTLRDVILHRACAQ